ncbi:MAG: diguanylate cyclase [Herminiimonas sp.]|nr:diguanylate cyclase [Herminiimonas sp.]
MGSFDKAATASPLTLSSALNQSEQVKHKVEECAQKLSSVNAVLKEEVIEHLPLERIEVALSQSEEVEDKVQECAADLASVNQALIREIAERKFLEGELARSRLDERKARHLAFHDRITGLPNRELFLDRLNTAVAQAERHGRGIGLLFIDIDDFKMINDCYGHAIGDEVLRTVAKRLTALLRTEDTVGRYGGNEFLCLLLEVRDENYAARIAEKIIASLSQPCVIGGLQLSIIPAIGITLYPDDGKNAEVLVNNSDVAMYVAKQNNRMIKSGKGYSFFSQIGK